MSGPFFPESSKVVAPISVGLSLFTDLLSGMKLYNSFWDLPNEGMKNAFDSAFCKMRTPGEPSFSPTAEFFYFENDEFSDGGTTVILRDNGEGLTVEKRAKFLKIGTDDLLALTSASGVFNQKLIGRIAMMDLVKDPREGYYFVHSCERNGLVEVFRVTPAGLCSGLTTYRRVDRRDPFFHGLCPETGTFGMVIFTNVVDKFKNKKLLEEQMRWYLPRRKVKGHECIVEIDGIKVEPYPLETELVIEAEGVVGYFSLDETKSPEGILICDAETNTVVAKASHMSTHVPYPFGDTTIKGTIFIPGVIKHQTTNRSRLSSDYLDSAEWFKYKMILLDHFSLKLVDHFNNELNRGIGRDSVGMAFRKAIKELAFVFGTPEKIKIPTGTDPKSVKGKGRLNIITGEVKQKKPSGRRNPSSMPVKYKGKTYNVRLSKLNPAQRSALRKGTETEIDINSNDPNFEDLKKSPLGLLVYLIEGIFMAIEVAAEPFDAVAVQQEVQKSLNEYFETKRKMKETKKKSPKKRSNK